MTKLFVFHLNEDGCWQNYSYSIQTKMAAGKIICISFEQKHIVADQNNCQISQNNCQNFLF